MHSHEIFGCHAFGEDVGLLEEGINFDEFDPGAFTDVRFEEAILDRDMLCARGYLDGFGSSDRSIIV